MLKRHFVKTFITMITTAFGFVAALAWNETIKNMVDRFISPGSTTISLLIYALSVTILAVLVTYWLGLIEEKAIKEEARKK